MNGLPSWTGPWSYAAVTQDGMLDTLNLLAEDLARFRREACEAGDVELRGVHEQLAAHMQWVLDALADRPGIMPGQAPWWPQFREGILGRPDPDASA